MFGALAGLKFFVGAWVQGFLSLTKEPMLVF